MSVAIWGSGQSLLTAVLQGPTAHVNTKRFFFSPEEVTKKRSFILINKNAFLLQKHSYTETIIPSTSLMFSQHFDKQPPHLCVLKERPQLSSRRTEARHCLQRLHCHQSWYGGPSSPFMPMQPTSLHISSHCSSGLHPSVFASGLQPLFTSISPTLLGAPGISQTIQTGNLRDRFQMQDRIKIKRIICCQNVLTDI